MQREENRYSHARFKGEFILTNCTSFGLNCDTFYASFSPCFVSCIFSKVLPVSQPAPQSLRSPDALFPFTRVLIFLPVTSPPADVSPDCLVSCADATNQAAHSSRVAVLQIAGNARRLPSSVSTDSYLSTSSSPSRSDWNWAK